MTEKIGSLLQGTMSMNNVNVVSKLETNNVNDNVVIGKTEKQVNSIASYIMEKLGTSDNWLYYCKVAWKLSESRINDNLTTALRGNSPQRYFTWLCNKDMK